MTRRAHRIIVRAKAEADIADAATWYERQQPNLGREFLDEVKSTIAKAAENPFHYARLRSKPEVRRALIKRFPYRVFFIRREGEVVVFRVLHAARHDREWKSKVSEE